MKYFLQNLEYSEQLMHYSSPRATGAEHEYVRQGILASNYQAANRLAPEAMQTVILHRPRAPRGMREEK